MKTNNQNNENATEVINNQNSNEMKEQSKVVATPNAEKDNAVETASVEQLNEEKKMGTFNFNTPQVSAVKKYDNEGAYQTLLVMMKRKEQLAVKFYSGKDNIPCAWIESKRVQGFKYQLKSETFQGLMNYLTNGEVTDFDHNPAETDTLPEDADFQRMVLEQFIESNMTIQFKPLFRERPLYISGLLPCYYGKVIFQMKRSDTLLDYLTENQKIA